MTTRRRLVLLAALAGALCGLCWLPFHLAPFLPLSLVPAVVGLRLARTPREALLFGLVFGAMRYAVGAHYILVLIKFSPLAVLFYLIDISYILPFALLEAWGAFWIERRSGTPRVIGFALIYSLMEWARTRTDLSNPFDVLAHAFGTHPSWLSWTPWTGPYFVAFLAMGVAGLLVLALESRDRPRRAIAVATLAGMLWFAPPLTDRLTVPASPGSGPTLRVGIVQPSFSIDEKLKPEHWPELRARLARLTEEAARGADLVIWPETSRPGAVKWPEGEPFSDPPVEELARRVGVPILYGCEIARMVDGEIAALYNGAALVRPDGGPAEWYGKQQLVPFVEAMPYARWFGWDPAEAMRKTEGGKRSYLTLMGNFSPGPKVTVFDVGPARIGVLICYEGVYPHLVRRFRLAGANALCVITNDAWMGRSVWAPWHNRMAACRAREADVPVVRAANAGVSSITDRYGRMRQPTELFEVTTLNVPLEPSPSPPTFYERYGDLFVWTGMIAVACLVVWGWVRGRPR